MRRKHSIIITLFAFCVAVGHLSGQEGKSSPMSPVTLSPAGTDIISQLSPIKLSYAGVDKSSPGSFITSSSAPEEITSPWSAGADFLSSYIWRGTRQGSGPHIQPALEYSRGSFTAGAWGTFDLHGYEEVDLWFAFNFPGGFTVGMQDYYQPGLRYFDYSTADGSHAFEINLDYISEHVWLSGNCVINEAGGIGSYGGDLYFEAGLSFDYFSVFMGAGNGWHTESGVFNVCNLGLEVPEEIEITDRFTVPVTGQLIFNPDREQLFIVVGFAF